MIRRTVIFCALLFIRCGSPELNERVELPLADPLQIPTDTVPPQRNIIIANDIPMHRYFEGLDSICTSIDSVFGRSINEYELVHANPRIIDTLTAQDYYLAKGRGIIIDNQQQCIILRKGDSLKVPNEAEVDRIREVISSVTIDVNIPEYTLRIFLGDSIIRQCPVRVGKNERKYLELAKHEVNLRTPIGDGHIIRIERDPIYMNPVDGMRYKGTWRDDGHYTRLPRIPFLEPEINGVRSGALIHPTTNRKTLGKAASNGCVGLSEADAWWVYYYAPIGTRVRFRYNLQVGDSAGNTVYLKDIYNLFPEIAPASNDHPRD